MPRCEEMTVGVEIETTIPSDSNVSVGAYHDNYSCGLLPSPLNSPRAHWRSESDSSIRVLRGDRRGCEFISPVLQGKHGLKNICDAIDALDNTIKARVNQSCGFHVHIGFDVSEPIGILHKIVAYTAIHEEALFAATGTMSRERGTYCRKLKGRCSQADFSGDISAMRRNYNAYERFSVINLKNLLDGGKNTVEFRLFGSTLKKVKAVAYVRMCMALVEKAHESRGACPAWEAPLDRERYTGGYGVANLKRFFDDMGWGKDRRRRPMGMFEVEGLPTLEECKTELLRLAKKYDIEFQQSIEAQRVEAARENDRRTELMMRSDWDAAILEDARRRLARRREAESACIPVYSPIDAIAENTENRPAAALFAVTSDASIRGARALTANESARLNQSVRAYNAAAGGGGNAGYIQRNIFPS